MANPHSTRVKLLPAVRSDTARIAEITVNSLDATPASQFLFKPAVYREGRRNAAVMAYFTWRTEAAFDDPTAEVIKAVNQSSGEILGFATWQFVEMSASSAETMHEDIEIPAQDHGGGNREPAIVSDVNMDLMRDFFTSTGHNQVEIAKAIRGASSACKFRSASTVDLLRLSQERTSNCSHMTRSMASLCRSFHAAGRCRDSTYEMGSRSR